MDYTKNWFISDLHLGHDYVNQDGEHHGIISFERHQFDTIETHDSYIALKLHEWGEKHQGETLWNLGDLGRNFDIAYFIMGELRYKYGITLNFIAGNHDRNCDREKIESMFDNVYYHPIYIGDRVILSHEPQYPLPEGCINIHGHLHGAILQDTNRYKNASIDVIGYQPFSGKVIEKMLSKTPKADYHFLKEPFAHLYRFTQPKEDVVYDEKGNIDLNKSLNKFLIFKVV